MIIKKPTITREHGVTTVRSQFTKKNGKTETVWVSLSSDFESMIVADATPFVSALTLPAMRTHDNIFVEGSVSSKWREGVGEIKERVLGWKVGFSPTAIDTPVVKPDNLEKKTSNTVGMFFSGGVDSFATFLKYKELKTKKITHFIFVHGFDIALKNTALYNEALSRITTIAKETGITCIALKTNVREITDQMLPWDMAHGGALAMVGLLLRGGLGTILIPGSGAAHDEEPWGSCSYLDPRWSTENLEIIHDLDHRTRTDKISDFIAKSSIALAHLRVCWRNLGYNCGVCDKCISTMIDLRIAGVLDRAHTFPQTLNLDRVRALYSDPYTIQGHLEQSLLKLTQAKTDPELQKALEYSLKRSYHPPVQRRVLNAVRDIDKKYNASQLFFLMNKIAAATQKK